MNIPVQILGFIVPALVVGAIALAVYKEHRRQMEGWNSPDTTPLTVGLYRVRIWLRTAYLVNTARWDGQEWRDLSNGHPCYFQMLQWKPLAMVPANTAAASKPTEARAAA